MRFAEKNCDLFLTSFRRLLSLAIKVKTEMDVETTLLQHSIVLVQIHPNQIGNHYYHQTNRISHTHIPIRSPISKNYENDFIIGVKSIVMWYFGIEMDYYD